MASVMLDRPLVWQKYTSTPDNYGQQLENWTDHKTVWAHKVPSRGNEVYEANQKVEVLPTQYVVRWDEGWKPVDRLKDGTEVFEITSVSEYAIKGHSYREHFLILTCSSRDSENTGRDG